MGMFDDKNTEAGRAWSHFWYAVWVGFAAIVLSLALSAGRAQSAPCFDMDSVEADMAIKLTLGGARRVSKTVLDTPEAVSDFFNRTSSVMVAPPEAINETAVVGLYKLNNGRTVAYLFFKDGCRVMSAVWETEKLEALLAPAAKPEKDSGLGRPPAIFGTDPNANSGPRSEYSI